MRSRFPRPRLGGAVGAGGIDGGRGGEGKEDRTHGGVSVMSIDDGVEATGGEEGGAVAAAAATAASLS